MQATPAIKTNSLQNVTMGENVQSIGVSAFSNCTALQIVTMSKNVLTINDYIIILLRKCSDEKNYENAVRIADNVFQRFIH